MSQPVKLSDGLVLDARLAGGVVQRSIAGQVEFWARLGRSVEILLNGAQVMRLCHSDRAQPLSSLMDTVEKPDGAKRLAAHLKGLPFPHYRAVGRDGLLERTSEDGSVDVGRFVGRQFLPKKVQRRKSA